MNPWRIELYRIIADGEWHDREQLIRHLMRYVPPNVGYRQGENLRRRQCQSPDKSRTRGDQRQAVKVGARDLVRQVIRECERKQTSDGDYLRATGDFLRRARSVERRLRPPPPPPPDTVTLMPHPGTAEGRRLGCCCPPDQDDATPYVLVDVGCALHGWTIEPDPGHPDP
jgi:hypothetical protein